MYAYGSLFLFVSINDITSRDFLTAKRNSATCYASFADLMRVSNGTRLTKYSA